MNASDCATAADVVCNPALSCPAAPACDFPSVFNQGAASVDITSDNETLCTNAGGTYDSGTNTCTMDTTSGYETVCTQAGGTWTGASCTAAPTPGSNDEAVCTSAGGTWDVGASTCTPAPAWASSYNCFYGGFCAQAAIDFPPAASGYTNVYDGHTQGAEPALGAGCNTGPGLVEWGHGQHEFANFHSYFASISYKAVDMCQ